MKHSAQRGGGFAGGWKQRFFRVALTVGGVLGWAAAGSLPAQTPTPNALATPWVQAPPAADPTPRATPSVTESAAPSPAVASGPLPAKAPPPATAKAPAKSGPPHAAVPGASVSPMPNDAKAKLERERVREMVITREEQTPDEQQTFKKNQKLWSTLPPQERQAIRDEVQGRIQTEIDTAYRESGLTLNEDQQELFALRYRQERRRMEREIQEKARAERSQRLPLIMEQLRHEFGPGAAVGSPKPTATPGVTVPVSPSVPIPRPRANPNANATPPGVAFRRGARRFQGERPFRRGRFAGRWRASGREG